ncbi:MAG: hypothetical protein HC822_03845 [Oscillochloris sp.]|nr:hypothetical protein [Oscillochloris sp.]
MLVGPGTLPASGQNGSLNQRESIPPMWRSTQIVANPRQSASLIGCFTTRRRLRSNGLLSFGGVQALRVSGNNHQIPWRSQAMNRNRRSGTACRPQAYGNKSGSSRDGTS